MTSNNNSNVTVDSAPVDPVTVEWRDLCYEIDYVHEDGTKKGQTGVRQLLKHVSGRAQGGRLLAIMGPSGCGKTTFLNTISKRVANDAAHRLQGTTTLNDAPFDPVKYQGIISFVSQDDIIFEMDTPREALYFNARVKTQSNEAEARKMVDFTLSSVGISHCADTVIGTPGLVRGLSGGERKRTNIGAELITNPRVILLDEPTTGLDSVTALAIIQRLRQIAHEDNRTVMMTIHQPSSEIFDVFDDLMLMSQGRVMYHGKAADAPAYFAKHGKQLPKRYNPSDFYMKLLRTHDHAELDKLHDAWAGTDNTQNPCLVDLRAERPSADDLKRQPGAGYGVQAEMLFRRTFRNMVRSPVAFHARLAQATILSILFGLIYFNVEQDQDGVQDRIGFLFMVVLTHCFMAIMAGAIVFPPERAVFLREQTNGAYNPVVYAVTRTLAELPLQVIFPAYASIILYWMADLRNDAGHFFVFMGTLVLVANTAQSFGILVASAIQSVETILAVVPMTMLPYMLAGGLMASTDRLDPYWLWLNYLSFVRYGYIMMIRNEFEGQTFECKPDQQCLYRTGDDVLEFLGFEDEVIWKQALILLAYMVFYRFLTVVLLVRQASKKTGT